MSQLKNYGMIVEISLDDDVKYGTFTSKTFEMSYIQRGLCTIFSQKRISGLEALLVRIEDLENGVGGDMEEYDNFGPGIFWDDGTFDNFAHIAPDGWTYFYDPNYFPEPRPKVPTNHVKEMIVEVIQFMQANNIKSLLS
jgi:hypothetical protein